MAFIKEQNEMNFNSYEEILNKIPFEVFYQTITSDQYNANGFKFIFNRPGKTALLSKDAWIEYTLPVEDDPNFALNQVFENTADGLPVPRANRRFSFRSGNIMARCIQKMDVKINNMTTRYTPYLYVEALNRLYISSVQSEHEFSASGGCFEEGNHGNRTSHQRWAEQVEDANEVQDVGDGGFAIVDNAGAGANTHLDVYAIPTWHVSGGYTVGAGQDLLCNMRPPFPLINEHYNPGFTKRMNKFAYSLRLDSKFSSNNIPNANAGVGVQYIGLNPGGTNYYLFKIRERVPIPLFKMYSTDKNEGVIPNITQMSLDSIFVPNLMQTLFRSDSNNFLVTIDFNRVTKNDCKLFIKWYIPPTITIPKEIYINAPKITSVSRPITMSAAMSLDTTKPYVDTPIYLTDISIEAMPDLLILCCKYNHNNLTVTTPDEFNLELLDLMLDINQTSGRVNGISSIILYDLWKKYLEHTDANIIGFEEWRKYCFTAVLRPIDIGIKLHQEYNKKISLGIRCTARSWWINPTIGNELIEPLGGHFGAGTTLEFIVTSIFKRNQISITDEKMEEHLPHL